MVRKKLKFESLLGKINPADAARGFDRVQLKGHTRQITCCRFVPLKSVLVSAAKDGSILLFDYSEFDAVKRTVLSFGKPKDPNGHQDAILAMDVSFDGKYLVTGGKDSALRVWDLQTNQFSAVMQQHKDAVYSVAFKFNSYECCSLSADRTMKVWDASQAGFMENL